MRRFILLFLLFIPLVLSSPEVEFQNEEIQPLETILGTITVNGSFTEQIRSSDMKFFEGRKETFMEHEIIFYDNVNYFYIYPNRVGNFTLKIQNILYKEGEELKSFDLEQEFIVEKDYTIDEETNATIEEIISIKPGFLYNEPNSSIKITNYGNINLTFNYEDDEITLSPYESYSFVPIQEEDFGFIEIESYKKFSIPFFLIEIINDSIIEEEKDYLKADPSSISLIISANNKTEENLSLYNFGESPIEDLDLKEPFDFIKVRGLEDILAKGIINISIVSSPKLPGIYSDNLSISYIQNGSKKELNVPISIYVLEEGKTADEVNVSEKNCSSLGGNICLSGNICDGEATFTRFKEYCCLGECVELDEDNEGGFGFIWGILILIILLGFGYYFYWKKKNFKGEGSQDKIKKISEDYSKRISGGLGRS